MEIFNVELMRRGDSYDVAGTLRMIGSDVLLSDATVMALDAPIATYRNGALAPELIALARRCTVPQHVYRVDTPDVKRATVVYLVELEHKQRLVSMPISGAAERLRKSGARVIAAMPYERYERYLIVARRKRDAAKRGN